MTILGTCLSGVFAMTVLAAPIAPSLTPTGPSVEPVPKPCQTSLATHWHLDAEITALEGREAAFLATDGCRGQLDYAIVPVHVRVGDHIRMHGIANDDAILITKVELIEPAVSVFPSHP